jgi:hypothetical protein
MQTPSAPTAPSVWIDRRSATRSNRSVSSIAPLGEFHAQLEGFPNAWQRVSMPQCVLCLKGG